MKAKLFKWVICAITMFAFTLPSLAQISVSVKNRPLNEVLPVLEKQGEFKFFYSSTLPDLDAKVTLELKDEQLKTILDALFKDLRIAYDIKNANLIVLSEKQLPPPQHLKLPQKGRSQELL